MGVDDRSGTGCVCGHASDQTNRDGANIKKCEPRNDVADFCGKGHLCLPQSAGPDVTLAGSRSGASGFAVEVKGSQCGIPA